MNPSFNPPAGAPPTLEWVGLAQLNIDDRYQRGLTVKSEGMIRKIARFWDWGLCQPLACARREDGSVWVVDGQHRLNAAKLRGDIPHLPCVVQRHETVADEAAAFVALNQMRRPLTPIDLFKAALASGDETARKISDIITGAGLTLANHQTLWKPGIISNISGIEEAYRKYGAPPVSAALVALAEAFPGQILRLAGTLFGGLAVFYADKLKDESFDPDLFIAVLAGYSQEEWKSQISVVKGELGVRWPNAGGKVFLDAYQEALREGNE